jgi:hypothetical protein
VLSRFVLGGALFFGIRRNSPAGSNVIEASAMSKRTLAELAERRRTGGTDPRRETTMRRKENTWLMLGLGLSGLLAVRAPARADDSRSKGDNPPEVGVLRAAAESLTGDVYADPSRWRPLSLGTLFSEGWNQTWVSPPAGGGGAPRQGWLNAADGVFYRLAVGTFDYKHGTSGNGDVYSGGLTDYAPFSRRFELQFDIPFVTSLQGTGGTATHTGFGDFQVTPRVILSETRDVTQSLNLTFRTPTGDTDTGNELAAVTPNYQFWANWWRGLVVRGSVGMLVPYHNVGEVGARTSFLGNLAAGYYFTDHDMAPFGDLVGYVATNLIASHR